MKTKLSPIVALIRTGVLTIAVTGFLAVLAVVFGSAAGYSETTSTNATDQTFSATNVAAKVAADYEKYKKGQIDKGQMVQSVWEANNHTRQDRYGKVVDQDSQPVAGVEVTGTIEFIQADKPDLHYKTQTDTNGLFQFTGLHGAGLAVKVAKAGYEMDNQSGGAVFDPSGQSSPTNRVIFMMWKLRGSEPMTHSDVESYIPRDGTANCFNLLTGRKDNAGGLTAQLLRDPLEIAPKNLRKPFNWSLTLTITNGGLFEYTNQLYPYEAPSKGYQKSITLSFSTNTVGWQSWAKRDYYFNDKNGQLYGRMTIEVHAGAPTPEAFFEINAFANPAGSRNLEFDPNKQIR